MRTRISLLIPTVGIAAVLTACGGGGVTKAAFTTKADGVCSPGNAAVAAVAKPTNAPQVATAAATAGTTIDAQVVAVRALKTPGGKDKAQIDTVVTAIAAVSPPAKALQAAAGKNDDPAMAAAALELRSKADAAALEAQGYGLTQCGTGLKAAIVPLFEGTRAVVKSTYVSKAEALCKDAVRRTNALTAPASTGASLGRFLDSVLAISTKLAADLKALPPPPGDDATVAEFHAAFDNLNAKLKEISAAAKANNSKLFAALSDEADVASTALNAKLDAYGLTACGSAAG